MKKRIIIAIFVIAAVSAAVTFSVMKQKNSSFLYAGTVESTEVYISARVPGIVDRLNISEGDDVKKGDLLAELSCEDLELAVKTSAREYGRAKKLLKAGSIDKDSYDKIKYKYDDSSLKLSWRRITSPMDATVISSFRQPGELVAPGTRILEISDLDKVWAYIYIAQPEISDLSLGMDLDAVVPENPEKELKGKVIKINSKAEFTPKNVQTRKERTRLVYGVKVEFENQDRYLKPGMTVEVSLPEK